MSNETIQTTSPAALVTAEWWAGHVFGGGAATSGDGMIDVLALLAGAQGRAQDPSKRDEFVAALAARIDAALARDGAERFGETLSTDYGPEGALADIARRLDLRGSFPYKTVTWTYSTHMTASLGYGAPARLVWHEEGWERPTCGQGQWDDDYDHRLPFKCGAPRWHEGDHEFTVAQPLCAGTLRDKPCLRPESDDYHDMDDAWSSAHHKFDAGDQ